MPEQKGIEKVDIKKVFREKNPGLANLLPGFIYRYLRKIIREKEINEFLDLYGDKFGADFAHAAIEYYNVKVIVKGEDNIPKDGKFIFVANHPLGGFDGIILMHLLDNMGFHFRLLVNDILRNLKNLDILFLPINKHGGNSRESVEKINMAFSSDMQLVSFPSGLVSRRVKGVVKDLEWQKSFVIKAKQHERNVIPVHLSGRNSNFFYNLSSFRKFLGIKANIEMFYLVDETYKHLNKTIEVTFGKPISYQTFNNRHNPKDWANLVKEHLYKLPNDINAEFKH